MPALMDSERAAIVVERANTIHPFLPGRRPVAPPVPTLTFLRYVAAGNALVDASYAEVMGTGFMDTTVIDVDTSRRRTVDLTDAVREFCGTHRDGLCNVFVPHATAGVAIIETGAGSDDDLIDTLERLLPRDERYRHSHGSRGHGADHVLPALVSPSVTVPVAAGRPLLGTWQSIVLVDLNRDNPRRSVRLSFLGD